MHTIIIIAHPYKQSYNHAILDEIKHYLLKNNETFSVIDLVEDNFNPVMTSEDLALYNKGKAYDPQVIKYQEEINKSQKLIIVFPIWWGGMPAIMKGFIDKVFLKNFSYKIEGGKVVGMLTFLKRTLVITTSSRTNQVLVEEWGDPITTTLVKSTFDMIGINDINWINFDNISKSTLEQRKKFLDSLGEIVVN